MADFFFVFTPKTGLFKEISNNEIASKLPNPLKKKSTKKYFLNLTTIKILFII